MREVLRTNNPVELNFAEAVLKDAGIAFHVFDAQMSLTEGSVGILPRRLVVANEDFERSQSLLRNGFAAPAGIIADTSEDRFLDGRVVARQPVHGFRAGLDAVMLAAAVPARGGQESLELGAGAGAASLCLAARVPDCTCIGVEADTGLVALANENALANGVADRIRFAEADVFGLPRELRRDFQHVFANPPFHEEDGAVSPDAGRDLALRDRGRLGDWLEVGLKRTASDGSFTAILRADRLGEALGRLPSPGLTIFPLWPRAGRAAKRVILQLRKDSRAPLRLHAGLVLHLDDERYTPEADAILRGAAPLDLR